MPKLLARLRPEHFYFKAHQEIYRTILELFEHGQLPDVVTVANRLEERGSSRRWAAEATSRSSFCGCP